MAIFARKFNIITMKKIYTFLLLAFTMMAGVSTASAQDVTIAELEGKYDLYGDITYEKKYQERGLELYGYYRVELVRDRNSENGFWLANYLMHALIFTSATEVSALDGYYCEFDENNQMIHVKPKAKGQWVELFDEPTYRYYYVQNFQSQENIFDIEVFRGKDGKVYLNLEDRINFVTPNDQRTAYEAAFHLEGFLARQCEKVVVTTEELYGTYDFAYSEDPNSMDRTKTATLEISPIKDEGVEGDGYMSVLGCRNMVIGYDYNRYGFMATYVANEDDGFLFDPKQPDGYLHCTFMPDGSIEFDGPVAISSNAYEGVIYYGRATKKGAPSGVENLPVDMPANAKIYGIDGRQHRLPVSGVNIIGGKKYIK